MDKINKSMVCFSGGMDSTWTLWRLATKTSDELYAHYAFIQKHTWGQAELKAVKEICNWITKNIRHVNLTISSAEYNGPTTYLRTPNIALHHAAIQSLFHGFDKNDFILLGRNATDDETELHEPLHLKANGRKKYDHSLARQMIIDLTYESDIERPIYRRLEPFPTRQEMVERLPKDLLDLFSSCNNPKLVNEKWIPCGTQTPGQSPMNIGECRKCYILSPYLDKYKEENGWINKNL